MKRPLLISLFFFAALNTIAHAQHHATAPAGTGAVKLLPGLDAHHHPTSTANAEAQAFFDQGLVLVYGFNHDEAARSFRRAAELDPQMAMAYGGIALAAGPNYNSTTMDDARRKTAHEAIQKALLLSAKAPQGAGENLRRRARAPGVRARIEERGRATQGRRPLKVSGRDSPKNFSRRARIK